MLTPTAVVLLFLIPGMADKKAAMVLSVQGTVILQTKEGTKQPAKIMDMLAAGDRLTVPVDGEAELVVLGDNHREHVKAQTTVTVMATGCAPRSAVERKDAVTTAVSYHDVHRFAGGGRGAVVVLRGPETPKKPPAVTPMFGSTVLSVRPTLSWQPVEGVDQYRVRLILGPLNDEGDKEEVLWTARTKAARLPYPKKAKPLHFGNIYSWHVIARPGQKDEQVVCRSQFWVIAKEDLAELAKVQPLTASKKPAGLLLAALTYQEYGVYEEALALFQRLTELLPKAAPFQLALADYYRQAGRQEDAKQTLKKARKLLEDTRPK